MIDYHTPGSLLWRGGGGGGGTQVYSKWQGVNEATFLDPKKSHQATYH